MMKRLFSSPFRTFLVSLLILMTVLGVAFIAGKSPKVQAAPSMNGLHVVGNTLQNGNGETLRLLGVNRSGTEYACIHNFGIFDGPSDNASLDAIAAWKVNVVRVPLNEACWLNISGAPAQYSGQVYRDAIVDYVNRINARNMAVILDLHWSAPGSIKPTTQQGMPNRDHSPDFWYSVASTFKNNSAVIFDLFNEPYPNEWGCWRNGSTGAYSAPCGEFSFAVAGMQNLVDAVRNAGANNIVMLGGLGYANWVGGFLDNVPYDPQDNIMAAVHIYNVSGCKDVTCYNDIIGPVAAQYPVTLGELGQNDCGRDFVDMTMDWADQRGVGYLGWAWNTYSCSDFPSLISDFNGTPTNFGNAFKERFANLAGTQSRAINCGGSASGSFANDTNYSGGSTHTTGNSIHTSDVTNPAPQAVYQSERYGNFSYTVSGLTANASHTVRLHFAEIYWTYSGARKFNVSINGIQQLSNFDIFATTGSKDKATVRQFTVNANSSGQITIAFNTVTDNAKCSGIEVL